MKNQTIWVLIFNLLLSLLILNHPSGNCQSKAQVLPPYEKSVSWVVGRVSINKESSNSEGQSEEPLFLFPRAANESPEEALINYLQFIHTDKSLSDLVPVHKWGDPSKTKWELTPLNSRSLVPRALVVANRIEDLLPSSQHLQENLPLLKTNGLKPIVLPIGVFARFQPMTRSLLYENLGYYFSLLYLMGGRDINPRYYGQKIDGAVDFHDAMDFWEIELIKQVIDLTQMRVFGICRGSQTIGVAMGCPLYQEISRHFTLSEEYRGNVDQKVHFVAAKSRFAWLARSQVDEVLSEIVTKSHHHQAVHIPADHPSLKVVGRSGDGVPKMFESSDGRILGSQNHLERDPDGRGGRIIKSLCQEILSQF